MADERAFYIITEEYRAEPPIIIRTLEEAMAFIEGGPEGKGHSSGYETRDYHVTKVEI